MRRYTAVDVARLAAVGAKNGGPWPLVVEQTAVVIDRHHDAAVLPLVAPLLAALAQQPTSVALRTLGHAVAHGAAVVADELAADVAEVRPHAVRAAVGLLLQRTVPRAVGCSIEVTVLEADLAEGRQEVPLGRGRQVKFFAHVLLRVHLDARRLLGVFRVDQEVPVHLLLRQVSVRRNKVRVLS